MPVLPGEFTNRAHQPHCEDRHRRDEDQRVLRLRSDAPPLNLASAEGAPVHHVGEEGEDDDGQASSYTKIHPETAEAIKELLIETESDIQKFVEYMGVDCINNILSKDLEKANLALGRKIKDRKPLFNN